ncbi:MAG: ring-opening amidohydrolase [Pseudomonadota bacterium]
MATRTAAVHRVAMPDPGDASGLVRLIETGVIDPAAVVCIMAKTPGNGLTNDHTREFATRTVADALAQKLGVAAAAVRDRVLLLFSGGTEGFLAPHLLVFTRGPAPSGAVPGPALAIGCARSRPLAPGEIGRSAQLDAATAAARAALADAALTAAEVAWVQVKCPIPLPGAMHGAGAADFAAPTVPGMKHVSRAACALGVAVALGEVARGAIEDDAAIGARPALRTGRACVTAAIDSPCVEVMTLGMSSAWAGDCAVGSTVLGDMLDAPAVAALLGRLDLTASPQLSPAQRGRLIGAILKGDPPPDDRLRDGHHVMLDDSDISPVRHYRAAMGGMLGALTGDNHVYLSGGAEHQAPPGGAALALLVRRN